MMPDQVHVTRKKSLSIWYDIKTMKRTMIQSLLNISSPDWASQDVEKINLNIVFRGI